MFNLKIACLCSASLVAMTVGAQAQTTDATQQPSETIVVTGSRVISDIANSPTPVTAVTTTQLTASTPQNLATGLLQVPMFLGSAGPDAGANRGGQQATLLNLRNFGDNRNLVLFDSHRVVSTETDGSVNIDLLPEMLIQRVDVVTGGASAVYGSDAVTGVTNFVLDKHFTGVKYDVNAGTSGETLGTRYKLGVAAGADIMGGRGHIEGTILYQHGDGVPEDDLYWNRNGNAWAYAGGGTTTEPYFLINNARRNDGPFGGQIGCGAVSGGVPNIVGPGCQLQGETFVSNGIPGPYDEGIIEPGTGPTSTLSSGGAGRHELFVDESPFTHGVETFARASYNVDEDIVASIQLRGNTNSYYEVGPNNSLPPGANRPNLFSVTNPFLTPQVQAQLASGNPGCPGGAPVGLNVAPSCVFYFTNDMATLGNDNGDQYNSGIPYNLPLWSTWGTNQEYSFTADLTGEWAGRWDWDVFFTDDKASEKITRPNTNFQKQYASEDAVLGANGAPECYVDTTSYASLYPNCDPLDPFGPTSMTSAQYAYWTDMTWYTDHNEMKDLGGSFAGNLFDLPAGPVKGALSGEMRWLDFSVGSNTPFAYVNCTGLRLCSSAVQEYSMTTQVPLPGVSENVWEVAGEVNVPILKDVPLVQSLSADLAGRYTDYSVSGAAETWKIGLDYHMADDIRFRAAMSVDIRAPTLNDLYQPSTVGIASLKDQLTGKSADVTQLSGGNASLVPEVSHTYTGGVVLTPTWIPNLTATIDYYRIDLYDAITAINYTSAAIQSICIQSGGSSQYCSLAVRPFPISNTSPANFPTSVYAKSLNSATQKTEGVDFETDYSFDLNDAIGVPGAVNFRNIFNYQPYITNISFPGAAPLWTPMPKSRDTATVDYKLGNWSVVVRNRWLSGYDQNTTTGQVFLTGRHVSDYNQIDVTINKDFHIDDSVMTGYFSIQDIADIQYPLAEPNLTSGASNPGYYPAPNWAWILGRYFTIGIRGEL